MTKVAIVEDNATFRTYLAGLVDSTPDYKCVCACESAEKAILEIPKKDPSSLSDLGRRFFQKI
jgi:DNA-binding NarL/FixJ family response regulator